MIDLIRREDAIDAMGEEPPIVYDLETEWTMHDVWVRNINALSALPSVVCDDCIWHVCNYNKVDWDADVADSDDLIIKGAKGIKDGLYNIKDGNLFKYKLKGDIVQSYEVVPSAEVVQGEWVEEGEYDDLWVCDQCGFVDEYEYNLCPICGAKMTKGDNAETNPIPEGTSLMQPRPIIGADLISRADAKQQISEWATIITKPTLLDKDATMFVLDSLPSIDSIQGWIPCSERLPSEDGRYLVVYPLISEKNWINIKWFGKPNMPNRPIKGKCFYESDSEYGDVIWDNVIAWMPLPKSYKGGDDE